MTKTSPTVLSTSQPDAATDQFHPGKCLPDCMMPDGGECCPGYVALYDAYWHLMRRAPAALAATSADDDCSCGGGDISGHDALCPYAIPASAATPLQKSAPVTETTHNSGEGDPSVMPDSIGADTTPAVGGEALNFPYQRTFDAICTAVKADKEPPFAIHVSVKAFQDAFNNHRDAVAPPASPLRGRESDEDLTFAMARLKMIEYALRKDSLTDHERIQSARSVVCAAISKLEYASPPEQPAAAPVQDMYFTDSSLPIMAMSGDVESDRVLKLHFRRKVTDDDRARLVEIINAGQLQARKIGQDEWIDIYEGDDE